MTFHLSSCLMFTALATLAACGSSGGGGGGGDGDGDGTSDAVLSDIEGTTVTSSAAGFQVGSGASISNATITVDSGFFDGDLDGTLEIFGETITITDGVGALNTGEEVRLTYETNRAGIYAAPIDATISSRNDINGETAFVVGAETSTSSVNAVTGTLTYVGDFQAIGSLNGANAQTEYEGGITVVVDFASDDADFTLDGVLDGATDVDLEGTGLDVAGNGISGDLDCAVGCSDSSSEVDATFYGPDANELGGVLLVDIAVDGDAYDGVGTFVIAP